MANTYQYIDGDGATHTLYVAGTTTDKFVQPLSERDWDASSVADHYHEPTPSRLADTYRGTLYKVRGYSFTTLLLATTAGGLEGLKSSWADWHDPELGEGQLKRITHRGTTRVLDCIPGRATYRPDIRGNRESQISEFVTQVYVAGIPWWRDAALTTASGAFTGTTAATIGVSNAGDIPAWIKVSVTGIVDRPSIAVGSDSMVVTGSSGQATDLIIYKTMPHGTYGRTVRNWSGGTGGVGTGGYTFMRLTAGSKYLQLPKGASVLTFTATSGTAAILVEWYNYYGSLF